MPTFRPTCLRPRLRTRYLRAGALALPALAAVTLVLLSGEAAYAQGSVPLVTVATDQSSLNLSNQFGIPAGTAVNQNGDFAFVGSGLTALFWRPAGTSSATRLLQIYDEAPGFPGSQIESFGPAISINASRVLLFDVRFRGADNLGHSALLTFNGASYQTLISSDQVAPGSTGATYGLELFPGTIDDTGDINFATVTVTPSTGAVALVFYILPASGTAAVRIVGTGDTPPTACTWCVTSTTNSLGGFFAGTPVGPTLLVGGSGFVSLPALNVRGQMLISLWGGLFIGSKDGALTLVPMAASGACSPQAPTKTIPTSSVGMAAFLNSVGAVAFSNPPNSGSGAICVAPPDGSQPTAVVSSGDSAPLGVGGGTVLSPVALGFDDSGDIVYESPISGSNVTVSALLRHRSSTAQPDVVAYNCEPAPGSSGNVFAISSTSCGGAIVITIPSSIFSGVSVANGGSVSFDVLLSNGQSAIYRQTGAAPPEFISVEVDGSVTLAAGVRISFSNLPFLSLGQTEILNNGSVFFASYLATGPADFAVNLGTPGNVQMLMSTADTLPSGAVTLVGSTPPRAAGAFVAFTAQPAAGRTNLLEADLTSGNVTRVLSDNDPALAAAGGSPGDRILTSNFFLNSKGQIALETSSGSFGGIGVGAVSIGVPLNTAWLNFIAVPCGAIYLWSPSGGLAKVAVSGDTAPGSSAPFACLTLNDGFPTPLNGIGQVAFTSGATIDGFVPCPLCDPLPAVTQANGVFLYAPAGTTSEIVATGDTLPGETQATTFVPELSVSVNSSEQVAFGAQLGTSSQGFFLRQTGGIVQKVMTFGDPIPGSSDTFGFPHFISGLTDGGNLAFSAATSSAIDGLFFAAAGGAIETVAVDGAAAPGGGMFSLAQQITMPTSLPPVVGNFAAMNSESDIAFGATLTGATANSGYFRAMHSGSGMGTLQPVALQGQLAPDGGTFGTIPIAYNSSADFALGPDGALAFASIVTSGSAVKDGMFVARPDGSLLKVAASGDVLPGGGVLSTLTMSPKLSAGDPGKFAFLARFESGGPRRGIFVTAIPPGTATATTALNPLQNPAVAQQPVTLAATVTSTTPGSPTGTVAFFANGISLGSAQLSSSGQATLTTSSLAAGRDSLLAQYSGDANFASDASAPMAIVAAGFAPPPAQLTVQVGKSLAIPLTVFAPAGSNMSFALSCSGLPANSSCAFDANPVAPAASGTALKLTLSTMAGSKMPRRAPHNSAPVLPSAALAAALAGLFAMAQLARSRAARLRVVCGSCFAIFALATLLSGCGAITSSAPTTSGTPTGAASFTVTGTSGTITITTTVKVTVQ